MIWLFLLLKKEEAQNAVKSCREQIQENKGGKNERVLN